jgi:hypothetical protein
MTDEEKGEWAEVADEGIVPVEDDDATRDGGQNRPEGDEEPDLRDAAAGPRQVDIDAAQS